MRLVKFKTLIQKIKKKKKTTYHQRELIRTDWVNLVIKLGSVIHMLTQFFQPL